MKSLLTRTLFASLLLSTAILSSVQADANDRKLAKGAAIGTLIGATGGIVPVGALIGVVGAGVETEAELEEIIGAVIGAQVGVLVGCVIGSGIVRPKLGFGAFVVALAGIAIGAAKGAVMARKIREKLLCLFLKNHKK